MTDNFRQKRAQRKPFHVAVQVAPNMWELHPLSVRKNRAVRAWRVLRATKFRAYNTRLLQPNEEA